MFYTIGDTAYLSIDSEITEELALEIKCYLDTCEWDDSIQNIELSINSVGGNVINGYTIFSSLVRSRKKTTTINTGACFSMAALILMAGQTRKAMDYSLTLIHNPFSPTGGADDSYINNIKTALMVILGHSFDSSKLDEWMNAETTFTAQQLLDMGVIDEVITSDVKIDTTTLIEKDPNEIYSVMNSINKNKKDVMKKSEIKNEVETVATTEVVNAETTPTETETTSGETNTDMEALVKAVNELKSAFENLQNEHAQLMDEYNKAKAEKEEVENKLKAETQAKEEAEKIAVLNKAGVSKENYKVWMNNTKAEIENLLSTVNVKKSPDLQNKIESTIAKSTMDDYTEAELVAMAKNEPTKWLELYNNTAEKRKK